MAEDVSTSIEIDCPRAVAEFVSVSNPDNATRWYVNIKIDQLADAAAGGRRFTDCVGRAVPWSSNRLHRRGP